MKMTWIDRFTHNNVLDNDVQYKPNGLGAHVCEI